jgi:hypothetical protein
VDGVNVCTLLSALFSQDLCVLVVADAADVPDGVRGEDVLGSAGGVLGGAAGDELCVAVFDQVVVDAHLVGFGEEGIVELEAVFLEHCFVADQFSLGKV